MLHLLKQEFGASKTELKNQCCYEFITGMTGYYVLYNKNNKMWEVTYSDKSVTTTKDKFIISRIKPISIYSITLGLDVGLLQVNKTPTDIYYTPLPSIILNELKDNRTHLLTGYLFEYPLREDFVGIINILKSGENLKVEYNGEIILTILKSDYDYKNNIFYCDSWSYIEQSIKRIEKKVITQHMRLTQSAREDIHYKCNSIAKKMLNKVSLENIDTLLSLLDDLDKDLDKIE